MRWNVGRKKAEVCSVRKDEAAGVCWPTDADAGMEDVGSRKTLCPVKKAGWKSAGRSSREESHWSAEVVVLV